MLGEQGLAARKDNVFLEFDMAVVGADETLGRSRQGDVTDWSVGAQRAQQGRQTGPGGVNRLMVGAQALSGFAQHRIVTGLQQRQQVTLLVFVVSGRRLREIALDVARGVANGRVGTQVGETFAQPRQQVQAPTHPVVAGAQQFEGAIKPRGGAVQSGQPKG